MSLPSWAPPDESKPAPLPLLLVQAFVNSYEADTDTDLLREPGLAQSWLSAAGLTAATAAPTHEELRIARQVRESIRAVLAADGPAAGPTDLEPLRTAARSCRPQLEVDQAGRVRLESKPGSGSTIDWLPLLLVIRDAQADGTWSRLKACENHECGWAFYDRSHSRRGRWCDMSICGNRMKNRDLRARRRTTP
jgi:predicted RNA-binding Zn ribbon-like protein